MTTLRVCQVQGLGLKGRCMDGLSLFFLIAVGVFWLQTHEQRRRVGLLAKHLAPTQVERILGTLIDGYLKTLDEPDPERQAQQWRHWNMQEQLLVEHFQRFADSFSHEPQEATRVSTLPVALPFFEKVFPQYSFDMRQALLLHAQAIRAACAPDGVLGKERADLAYTMTAELLLMQHTCHWFGKSRAVASMRMVARHKTPYEKVLGAVQPITRQTYLRLTQGR